MFEELAGDVLVDRIVLRQLQGDPQQVQAVHRHPAGCVGLFEMAAAGSGLLRSNTPMLSRPRKPPWKMFRPSCVLAVHPPGEIEHELVEDALRGTHVAAIAALLAVDL